MLYFDIDIIQIIKKLLKKEIINQKKIKKYPLLT